jgi:hypothetical protein
MDAEGASGGDEASERNAGLSRAGDEFLLGKFAVAQSAEEEGGRGRVVGFRSEFVCGEATRWLVDG